MRSLSHVIVPALFMSAVSVSEAFAGAGWGAGSGFGGSGRGGASSAPEIDGPAGVAAIALLVGAGLIAYNRFRKK
jgi:hypothetical protein